MTKLHFPTKSFDTLINEGRPVSAFGAFLIAQDTTLHDLYVPKARSENISACVDMLSGYYLRREASEAEIDIATRAMHVGAELGRKLLRAQYNDAVPEALKGEPDNTQLIPGAIENVYTSFRNPARHMLVDMVTGGLGAVEVSQKGFAQLATGLQIMGYEIASNHYVSAQVDNSGAGEDIDTIFAELRLHQNLGFPDEDA